MTSAEDLLICYSRTHPHAIAEISDISWITFHNPDFVGVRILVYVKVMG